MVSVRLGKTEIVVNKNGFGALPIQRIDDTEAKLLIKKAYNAGINFFDTARCYTDSEKKLGEALCDVRERIVIATKTMALTTDYFWAELRTSLSLLKTEYIDIYQFHNPPFCPKPGDGTGLYEAMLEAKEMGMIRHIGITNHRLHVAREAIESGLYETLQFPFNYLATKEEKALVEDCYKADMGFISMKALSGGLITNSKIAYAFQAEYSNVVPIWGVQKEAELDEFIDYIYNPPTMNEDAKAIIEKDRKELSANFCRGCGYCVPTCPAKIQINDCARMSLMIRRSYPDQHLTPDAQARMKKIESCIHCGLCSKHCPYGLDTPKLLEDNYKDYCEILAGKSIT